MCKGLEAAEVGQCSRNRVVGVVSAERRTEQEGPGGRNRSYRASSVIGFYSKCNGKPLENFNKVWGGMT